MRPHIAHNSRRFAIAARAPGILRTARACVDDFVVRQRHHEIFAERVHQRNVSGRMVRGNRVRAKYSSVSRIPCSIHAKARPPA